MRAKAFLSLCLSCSLLLPTAASAEVSGTLAPKLSVFGTTGGGDATRAHRLQRYDYRKGWLGDNVSGAYLDFDLGLAYSNGNGSVLSVERRGDGLVNQAGRARFDNEMLGVGGYYSHYRSVSVGLDYLTRPDNVLGGTDPAYNVPANTNVGYTAQFNNDAAGSFFRIDRTNYGADFRIKPALLGDVASFSVKHDGYRRVGNTYATWLAGGSDFGALAGRQLQRWRGYDKPVNETMDRGSIGFAASPKGWFQFAYDGTFEKFVSRARNYIIGDFRAPVVAAGHSISAANGLKPLHFIPDSTQTSHSLRLSRTFAKAAVAAGYAMSTLGQDSFTAQQDSVFYGQGKIASQNFFVNAKARVASSVEADAYLKYGNRRNDSTFPAVGLLNSAVLEQLDMRLNTVKTVEYGGAATFRPEGSKASLGAGWRRLSKKRGFTLNASAAGAKAERMLYEADSNSNEVYLKGSARPLDGVSVRLTPSYEWADKVGSPVDAKQAVNLKAEGSYAAAGGTLLSGYYAFKDRRSSGLDYANGTTAAQTSSVGQNVRNVLHSAGVSLGAPLTPTVNSSVSADWTQNDFESDFLTSSLRRYEAAAIAFTVRERSNSVIDTHSLSLATDWQALEALKLSGAYSLSRSKGNMGTGVVGSELGSTMEGSVYNHAHSVALGADYALSQAIDLMGQYVFDYYKDMRHGFLSGSAHTVTTALAYRF
ncbi:hypothetical protein EPO15_12675 [bacterium]|nr:MAG: hypothetical protein EPO15_12675 [bacterium]